MNRRDFLKVAGASLLAGLGAMVGLKPDDQQRVEEQKVSALDKEAFEEAHDTWNEQVGEFDHFLFDMQEEKVYPGDFVYINDNTGKITTQVTDIAVGYVLSVPFRGDDNKVWADVAIERRLPLE